MQIATDSSIIAVVQYTVHTAHSSTQHSPGGGALDVGSGCVQYGTCSTGTADTTTLPASYCSGHYKSASGGGWLYISSSASIVTLPLLDTAVLIPVARLSPPTPKVKDMAPRFGHFRIWGPKIQKIARV